MGENKIQIFRTADGQVRLEVSLDKDTVWLTQRQMAALFDKDVRTINEHVRNVYDEQEVSREPTIRKFRIVQKEGARQVEREVEHYNLDVVISVGYRVKSARGVQFRQWATQLLRDYLVQGYAINQARFDQNAAELQQALALIHKAAQSPELSRDAGSGLVEIVSRYTQLA